MIKVDRDQLTKAVKLLPVKIGGSQFAGKILLENLDGVLAIRTTDSTVSTRIKLDGSRNDLTDEFIVSAKQILSLAKFKEGEITFIEKNGKLSVSQNKAKLTIKTEDGTIYPAHSMNLDDISVENIRLPIGVLLHSLESALEGTAKFESTRFNLLAVNFFVDQSGTYFQSTDGTRMTSIHYDGLKGSHRIEALIPRDSASILVKLMKSLDQEDVTFSLTNNHLVFNTESIEFSCSLGIGKFPDLTKLLNYDLEYGLELTRESLDHIDMAKTTLDGSNKLLIHCGDNKIEYSTLTASGSYKGEEPAEFTADVEFAVDIRFFDNLGKYNFPCKLEFSRQPKEPLRLTRNTDNLKQILLIARMA